MPVRLRHTVLLVWLLALTSCGGTASPTMTWHAVVTDATTGASIAGHIYIDDVPFCGAAHTRETPCPRVTAAEVSIPADGQLHALRVKATGYQVWTVGIRGEARGVVGPVRLKPLAPPHTDT